MSDSKVAEELPLTKEGLPWQAFAIVGDKNDPDTWKLPHHNKSIFSPSKKDKGRLDLQRTVDWNRITAAVAAISPGGYREERVQASPEDILQAAKHLANHYRKAGKSLPDTLAALV